MKSKAKAKRPGKSLEQRVAEAEGRKRQAEAELIEKIKANVPRKLVLELLDRLSALRAEVSDTLIDKFTNMAYEGDEEAMQDRIEQETRSTLADLNNKLRQEYERWLQRVRRWQDEDIRRTLDKVERFVDENYGGAS